MEALTPIIITFLIVTFSYTYFVGRMRKGIETYLCPLLNIQCGAGIGLTNICYPLARQTLYEDFLIISYGNARHTLKYKDIKLVKKKPYLFTQSVRLIHNNESLPKRVTIWSKEANYVIKILGSRNVNVENV